MAQQKQPSGQGMYGQNPNPYYPSNPYLQYYPSAPQGNPYQQGQMVGGQSTGVNPSGMLPSEQSYVENILRLNQGKVATVYMTFEGSEKWTDKVFKGQIEAAGRDHIILSDPETGRRYLLLMVYLDYITFDEEIEYNYPYGNNPGMAQYSPR
ncbi:spore coat protein GerQ [Halobacillus salinarum]|uniref:Spore coat protein GerQ n=1 Tax=Halobacillus salinarum TaxID=2932257 RepID=A0ABY4EMR5_9BACI|nr:spore coat protein GerQ [Halobacillus salinarum]UOQ45290.1 spore coat protein GerQ [Halobacillus salinarum]